MTNLIPPDYCSLIQLLSNRLFTIPEYQRSYSWSKRQRDDLFDDIESLEKEKDDETIHFMAMLVCRRRGKVKLDTDRFIHLDVVDGQQRLTTLVILFNAIRYALDQEDDGQRREADKLETLLIKQESEDLLLLQTNHDSSHFFETYLRKGTAPSTDTARTLADRNLLSAIHECRRFVDAWVGRGLTLLGLANLIKHQLMFVLYETSDEKTVYTVFEVLNSRGILVASLDKLKTAMMGLAFSIRKRVIRERLIDQLHNTWRDIHATIGLRKDLDTEALRFAATLYLEDRPSKLLSEEAAVDVLRDRAGTSASSIRKVARWVSDVTKACQAVRLNRRQEAVTAIVQARLLGVALNAGDFRDEEVSELLAIWERVSFRIYGLHDKDARTGVGDYCRLAWDIVNTDISFEDVYERIRRIGSMYPIEDGIEKMRSGFRPETAGNADCYTDWTDQLRYLLFRYEEHLAEKSGESIDNNHWEFIWAKEANLSIEHIRPQSTAPDDIKHSMGNLMLLPPGMNSRLSNKPPREKAATYRKTGFHHASEVADMLEASPGWSKGTCKRREKKILDWVRKEWGD